MRMHVTLWASDDRASRGQRSGTPQEGTRADRPTPVTEPGRTPTETPADTETGGQRISGPGPNDLTRGLP